jgi:hypothetical protein
MTWPIPLPRSHERIGGPETKAISNAVTIAIPALNVMYWNRLNTICVSASGNRNL